jgi:antitoxin CptB
MSSGQDRFRKLRWQSRRGMKEFDVLFEPFFEAEREAIENGDWPQLEALLSQEDDLLFDWVSGRVLPSDPGLQSLLNRLRNIT